MRSRPALKVVLAFIAGLILGRYFNLPSIWLLSVLLIVLLIAIVVSRQQHLRLWSDALLLSALVLAGMLRFELVTRTLPSHSVLNFTDIDKPVQLYGMVVRYPELRTDKINLVLTVNRIAANRRWRAVSGRVLVRVPRSSASEYAYGDSLIVTGRLRQPRGKRNPGEFDYASYLFTQGIVATFYVRTDRDIVLLNRGNGNWFLQHAVFPAKDYLSNYISTSIAGEAGALLRGLLIGERGEITPETREAFAKSGVIHILAVSGMHVGFIILIIMGLLGILRCRYRWRVALTLVGLIFYACLTNLKPSVVRASTMGGLILLSTALERRTDFLNTLAIAALLILVFKPLELFEAGFQLSFSAVVAIVYLYPRLRRLPAVSKPTTRLQRWKVFGYAVDLFVVSIAAFIGTLPLTVLYFSRLPHVSIFSNMIVIPLSFGGLITGLTAAVVNLVWSSLAELYAAASSFLLQVLLHIVEWSSSHAFAFSEFYHFSFLKLVFYFAALLLLANLRQRRARVGLAILILAVANYVVWFSVFDRREKLRVTYLDVGQGDAILISTPKDQHILIDGGPRGFSSDAGKWVIAPFLKRSGVDALDALVLSHPDADHLGGIPHLLRNIAVREVWDNGQTKETRLYADYAHLLDSLAIEHRVLHAGMAVMDFEPLQIFVLHPSSSFITRHEREVNESSLSLKVSFGEMDFLFAGDVERAGERALSRYGSFLASEVLKVNHHGSKTSTTKTFLDLVQPQKAVIQVGEYNKFGHPHAEVLARLQKTGSELLRTDLSGAVILESDGRSLEQVDWKPKRYW